jgi:hypothetical protein
MRREWPEAAILASHLDFVKDIFQDFTNSSMARCIDIRVCLGSNTDSPVTIGHNDHQAKSSRAIAQRSKLLMFPLTASTAPRGAIARQ